MSDNMLSEDNILSEFVGSTADKFGIPGAAVGVWTNNQELFAYHGVTSVENPLPVDENTLFLLGSVTKTYTATALMCLVANGQVQLKAPVRQYVPELQLSDERATSEITVLNLLNHTAGLDWRVNIDSGEGDDALAREVASLSGLKQIAPPGTRPSYSQAGYNLAGRILEKVTGLTYEGAVASLILDPLNLSHSFFARDDIMTRRFVVGHNRSEDGVLSIARPWTYWRSDKPGGGLASSVADQIRWARFHLGDGCAASGVRVLPAEVLHRMKTPTVSLQGSSLGDAFGICWFLRDVDGIRTIGHGGSANGQFAEILLVPERNFAVVSLANAGPDGTAFNQSVIRWALQTYLGVTDQIEVPLPYDEEQARQVIGTYENDFMTLTINSDGLNLILEVVIKPEIRLATKTELPADLPSANIGLLPGGKDEYVVTNGGLTGQRGFFTRDEHGIVVGIDMAGRLFKRI